MWGVLSLVRQGVRRRRAARVADESALGRGAAIVDGADAVAGDVARAPPAPAALGRALLAMACGAVRLVSGQDGGGSEEAWAASGWRPARAADEVGHLMVSESLRYAIYA